jgi:hypothetical protein
MAPGWSTAAGRTSVTMIWSTESSLAASLVFASPLPLVDE